MTAMPASRAAAGPCSTTRLPSMSRSPSSGGYTPASIFTMVDLPAPFSPSSACASPAYRSADPSTTACTAPNDFAACRSDSTGPVWPAGGGQPVRPRGCPAPTLLDPDVTFQRCAEVSARIACVSIAARCVVESLHPLDHAINRAAAPAGPGSEPGQRHRGVADAPGAKRDGVLTRAKSATYT